MSQTVQNVEVNAEQANKLVPKLDISNLAAVDGSSESTALQEVSDTASGLRGSAAELAGLLSNAQDCMKRHAALADTYHDACMTLMQKHANSTSRPLQAQLEEAHAVNAELEARVRSLNDRLQAAEAERTQLQAFKDSITGVVQQALVPSPVKPSSLPVSSPAAHTAREQPGTPTSQVSGIANLESSLVPKASAAHSGSNGSTASADGAAAAAAASAATAAVADEGHDTAGDAADSGAVGAPSAGSAAASDAAPEVPPGSAPMDDTVEGIAGEQPAEPAAAHTAEPPGTEPHQEQPPSSAPVPFFSDLSAGGALEVQQLSSGKTVAVPQAGVVLGRSSATQHGLDELGLKVHRKHLQVAVQAADDGAADITVQRLGLNAASVIHGADAKALGLLDAEGRPLQEELDVAALVAAAEAKECVHAVGKKHSRSVAVGDVLVLCNSLQGAFLLQYTPPATQQGGIKRSREEDEESGSQFTKSART